LMMLLLLLLLHARSCPHPLCGRGVCHWFRVRQPRYLLPRLT
jgi:hypothetical protein